MKRILLLALIFCFNMNLSAQCDSSLPVTETFDNSSVIDVCWNLIDSDGDGKDWYWREYGSTYGGYKCLTSRSFSSSSGNLNPDNWIISYAIDLTSYNTSETIELSWKVRGEIASAAHEYYTVYAATGYNPSTENVNVFESSAVKRGEYADEVGAAGVFATRTLDISSLAGNNIYIAFRHENISGSQFILNIDDVSVSNSLLGNEDFEISNFKHYYNKNTDILTLNSKTTTLDKVQFYNILGQQVLNKKLSQYVETINLSNLKNGIYIAKVESNNAYKTIKFIKH